MSPHRDIRHLRIRATVGTYHDDILPRRINTFASLLETYATVRRIIVYGERNTAVDQFRRRYPSEYIDAYQGTDGHQQEFPRYQLSVDDRHVELIHMPYFRKGRTSYMDVVNAARYFTTNYV